MELRNFIRAQIKAMPIEARILNKIIREFKGSGNPIVKIYDGEETYYVSKTEEIFDIVFNLDECHLYTKSGDWIFFVLGNKEDCICDYTISIEQDLAPVNEYIEKNWY